MQSTNLKKQAKALDIYKSVYYLGNINHNEIVVSISSLIYLGDK